MKTKSPVITMITILFAAGVLTSCGSYAGVERENPKEADTESETAGNQKAKTLIESEFNKNGITEFERVDLSEYEQQAGVVLADDYISYHFFYESDGFKIEAYLSAPIDLLEGEESSKCLIYNHGGNRDYGALEGMETTFYAYQYQTVCLASNYRGCGESEGFDSFGGEDVDDIIHLIDLCEKISYINPQQINMLGVSRGGMMTYEVLRDDERIRRAVVVAGIADSFMEYDERDDMKEVYKELVGGTPQEMPEEYEKRSANYWAEQINTPLLIFHTTGDNRVSIEQSKQLAEKLGAAGKEYQFVSIESNEHGDLRSEDVEMIRQWIAE